MYSKPSEHPSPPAHLPNLIKSGQNLCLLSVHWSSWLSTDFLKGLSLMPSVLLQLAPKGSLLLGGCSREVVRGILCSSWGLVLVHYTWFNGLEEAVGERMPFPCLTAGIEAAHTILTPIWEKAGGRESGREGVEQASAAVQAVLTFGQHCWFRSFGCLRFFLLFKVWQVFDGIVSWGKGIVFSQHVTKK